LPVKDVLKASTAEIAASESPITIKVRGSIFVFLRSFFLANAGTCSGIITLTWSSLVVITNELILRRVGP